MTVAINAGVILQAGITTGAGWVAGSGVVIVNKGTIAGIGGALNGATGDGGSASPGTLSPGQDGQPGGDAIALSCDVTIDNTSGNICGGGGQVAAVEQARFPVPRAHLQQPPAATLVVAAITTRRPARGGSNN